MAAHLGVDLGAVRSAPRDLGLVPFARCAAVLAADLDRVGPVPACGLDRPGLPVWSGASGGLGSWPQRGAYAFPAGALAPAPLVVLVTGRRVEVLAAHDHAGDAERYLAYLLERGRGPCDPFRGVVLHARLHHGFDLELTAAPIDRAGDDVLVLPEAVERALDTHVRELLDRLPLLAELGFGANRGILLAGPPGTGKTALCRRLARQFIDRANVVVVDARVLHEAAGELYEEAQHLAPCLVILEDLDLALSSRELGGASADLMELLAALDGVRTRHTGVVTVATTNNPDGLDPALRRAARFDRVVHLPLPDRALRARILAAYVAPLGLDGDVAAVAARCEGASGAELRELVRLGALRHGRGLTVADLGALAGEEIWRQQAPAGVYL